MVGKKNHVYNILGSTGAESYSLSVWLEVFCFPPSSCWARMQWELEAIVCGRKGISAFAGFEASRELQRRYFTCEGWVHLHLDEFCTQWNLWTRACRFTPAWWLPTCFRIYRVQALGSQTLLVPVKFMKITFLQLPPCLTSAGKKSLAAARS